MLKAENITASRDSVWLCEACESRPAAFLCKADNAYLCASCDSDIHSANPLARRHHRVPIHPMLYGPSSAAIEDEAVDGDDEDEAASWLLLTNPAVKSGETNQMNGDHGGLFGGGEVVDEYLDLDDYNGSCHNGQFGDHCYDSHHHQQQDFSVPQKGKVISDEVKEQFFQLGLDFDETSSAAGYNYPSSLSHSVSFSSMDVGVVPESTEETISHQRPPKGTIDLFTGLVVQPPTPLTPKDREARVLRYREKKKTRKFEKTIRYASRKAYAETRPRVKGRFAKRTDAEAEGDQMFISSSLMAESAYGIVPSF